MRKDYQEIGGIRNKYDSRMFLRCLSWSLINRREGKNMKETFSREKVPLIDN